MEMVGSVGDLKSSRSIAGKITEFRNTGREDCLCSEQDHPEFPHQEESQSRGTKKAQKEDPFLRGKQIAFMIYVRLLSSDWRS